VAQDLRERMRQFLRRLAGDDGGQDLIEYALLAALISVLAVVAITSVGTKLNTSYQNIEASIP
jgi:pilus assembly protein Flp/PilA